MDGDVAIGAMVLREGEWINVCYIVGCDKQATNDVRVGLGFGEFVTPFGVLEVAHTSAAHVCATHYGDTLMNYLSDVFGEVTGHRVGELL